MNRARHTLDARLDAYTHEALAVSSTAVPLTFNNIVPQTSGSFPGRPAERVFISCETDQVRYTYDGTTPTASAGHLMNVGDILILSGHGNIRRFQAIRVTTDATLRATYER